MTPGGPDDFPQNGGLIQFTPQTGKMKNTFSPPVIIIRQWMVEGGHDRHDGDGGGGGNEFIYTHMRQTLKRLSAVHGMKKRIMDLSLKKRLFE